MLAQFQAGDLNTIASLTQSQYESPKSLSDWLGAEQEWLCSIVVNYVPNFW
jgi:hypothetical protein